MSKNGHDSNDGGNDRQDDTSREDNSQADFHGNRTERQEGAENTTPSQRLSNDLSVEDYRQFQGDRQWGVHRDESGDLVFESSSIYGNGNGNGHGRDHHHRDGDRHNDDGTVTLENGDNDVRIDRDGNITIQMDGHDNNGNNRELKIGKDGKVTLPNGEEVDASEVLKDRDKDGKTDLNEIMQNSAEAEAAATSGTEATDNAADNGAPTTSDSGTVTMNVNGSASTDITITGQGNIVIDDGQQVRIVDQGALDPNGKVISSEIIAQQYSPEALEQRARLAGDVAGVAPDGRDINEGSQGVSITENGALQWNPGNGQQITMQDGNITIKDGNRSVTISDGQIAMSNGATPIVSLPDGSIQVTMADGTKMTRGTDGSVTINSTRNGNYFFPRGEQGAASATA